MTGVLRALVPLLAAVVVVLAAGSVAVELDGRRERPGRGDVIVVLGARVRADGTPSERLTARLSRGLAVWREGRAPFVIVSGGVLRGVDEAHSMKRWLVAHGVPDSVVVEDPLGHNTWETARFTRAWLAAHGGHSAIAVSQYFHLPRCRLAFDRFGIAPVATAAPAFVEWREVYSAPREVLGLVEYAVRPSPQPLDPGGRP